MPRSVERFDCAGALALLEPHLDGELSPAEQARLATHLGSCPACAEELRLAGDVRHGLRALPELDCPPEVLARAFAAAVRESAMPGAPPAARQAEGRQRFRRLGRRWRSRLEGLSRHLPSWRLPHLTPAARIAAVCAALLVAILIVRWPHREPPAPSPEEMARATREARFALAYVDQVSRRAALRLRDQVLERHLVLPAARDLSRSLQETLGADPDLARRIPPRSDVAERDRS
ncbi:MAG TPA: zf-HC2 domain-containing protein [Thermoanaerobaculia bacterium]|nr:zf-HC2 domain-containing protein [Thermoanaerobaculia bacterium]